MIKNSIYSVNDIWRIIQLTNPIKENNLNTLGWHQMSSPYYYQNSHNRYSTICKMSPDKNLYYYLKKRNITIFKDFNSEIYYMMYTP